MVGLGIFIGFVVGLVVGVGLIALCMANGEDSRRREYEGQC